MASEIVFTRKARCRDCHRCLRACPVKAIAVHDGQAQVVAERCIACGTCIRECPQSAKTYRNDVAEAVRLLAEHRKVVVSVAPSFAGVFEPWEQARLASALRRLGFAYVAETAAAAAEVANAGAAFIADNPGTAHAWSSCPAVTDYIRRYRPDDAGLLVPIASPMVAHARWLRSRLGNDIKIIFLGPCVAKKAEAERADIKGLVDVVLTFAELSEWLAQENIVLSRCEESAFDERGDTARLYPLPDGALRTAGMLSRDLGARAFSASGFSDVDHALDLLAMPGQTRVVEPLFCAGGCINGPATGTARNVFARRFAVESRPADGPSLPKLGTGDTRLLDPGVRQPLPAQAPVTEAEILAVLATTGKSRREDQLDCAACGYASCREKAIAVVRKLAEPDMCIPHMRRLAEIKTDAILEGSPNGILLLDAHFHILSMNPAFRRHFRAGEATLGRHVSELMDPEPFLRLSTRDDHVEITVNHERFGVVCHQILYRLPEADQFVGIFVDITESKSDQQKLEKLRAQTIVQAQELLDHQVAIAQQLAQFLGESTAKGEVLVENLLKLADKPRDPGNDPVKKWRWNTSTSK